MNRELQDIRFTALLIIGHTGSGKTPLGEICETRGLWGKRCAHFDFGAMLRNIAAMEYTPNFLTGEDMDVIRNVLSLGALLEDEQFHIAENILRAFISNKGLEANDMLVLNGLPRHEGQAQQMETIVDVKTVVHLVCSPEVVFKRIHHNSGGDRTGRTDDTLDDIRLKLEQFEERTVPLLDYYRNKKTVIEEFEVLADTTPEEMYEWVGRNVNYRAKLIG
ncbi:MAG: nucleoside monophosphate kinase [Candidatus Latescibacteria bacterium]|nr:nucleoside monophosphate kinase [Candidatus Latescibacterota bacterium]